MRLIDADALLENFAERQNLDCSDGEFCDCFLNSAQEVSTEWWCVEDAVESAPTIDAAPVVHARWVHRCRYIATEIREWCCSACGELPPGPNQLAHELRYCPNCGAKMDGRLAQFAKGLGCVYRELWGMLDDDDRLTGSAEDGRRCC